MASHLRFKINLPKQKLWILNPECKEGSIPIMLLWGITRVEAFYISVQMHAVNPGLLPLETSCNVQNIFKIIFGMTMLDFVTFFGSHY